MNIALNLLIVGVVVVWIALVVWTYTDAKRRVKDGFLVGCATVGALFPFVGSLVYLIVRPPELLEDVRERELDIAAAEARLESVKGSACPHCDAPGEKDFLRCPSCLRKLREPCPSCSRPLDPQWRICPYCEADPLQVAASPRRRRTATSAPREGEPETSRAAAAVAESDGGEAREPRPKRATTKAAAKRSTRRRPAEGSSDRASSSGGGDPDGDSRQDRDGSPEPEPTA